VPTDEGEVHFRATSRLAERAVPEGTKIRRLSAEQSNSSVILGDVAVLKVLRRIVAGIHPEAEMTRRLTEAGFANIAPQLGEVVRVAPDGTPHTLMLLQGFVHNHGDGWGWTPDWLARSVDEAALTDPSPATSPSPPRSAAGSASSTPPSPPSPPGPPLRIGHGGGGDDPFRTRPSRPRRRRRGTASGGRRA
jgi:trehalose synthase-fused probable maltokinase